MVVRPAMMYGSNCWTVDRKTEQKMRMLMSGMTREDKIRNKYIRVVLIVDKMRENRLRLLGHVFRREVTETMELVKEIYVDGEREKTTKTEKQVVGCDSELSK